jgi:hypothetical protein
MHLAPSSSLETDSNTSFTTHTWLFFMGNVLGHFTKHSYFIEFWVGSGIIRLHNDLDLSRSNIFT